MAACGPGGSLLQGLCISLPSSYRQLFLPTCTKIQQMNYAKALGAGRKGKGKLGPTVEKVRLPVETDPEKLVNNVCGSHPVKENREDIILKDDSEYPEWLWTLRTGKPPPMNELDPNSKEYWKRIRTMAMKEKNLHKKIKKF
ncbi:39S ribosomal protein L54, mitochondrial-like [Homarus americanus]|nr:39S ribosomal protein L54, mitochondrial-like [Homarus americanus]